MKQLQLAPVVLVLTLPFLLGLGLPSQAQEGLTSALLDGIVIPKRQVKLTPLVDGRLTALRVAEGTQVEEGERLAEIEDSLARASVDAARAQAERTADHVKATFARDMADRRLKRLVAAEEAVSELEIEQARAALVEAEATLVAAEEVKTQSEKNLLVELVRLENHYVRAPFDGEITRVQANVGATLTSATEHVPSSLMTAHNSATLTRTAMAAQKAMGVAWVRARKSSEKTM